jgi:hypothetical protein
MKKFVLLAMLLGVVTSTGVARERYKIMIRTDIDGKSWYYPMKKVNSGLVFKTWFIEWPLPTQEGANMKIDEWKLESEQNRLISKRKYVYIN